jgi:hypothetical protein
MNHRQHLLILSLCVTSVTLQANKASFNEAYGSLALQGNTTGTGNSVLGEI